MLERLTLPGTRMVITLDSSHKKFHREFRDVHGAEIYRAPSLLRRALNRQPA